MKLSRKPVEVFSLSFLDVISCGFGSIVLLLVLSLALEPATLKRISADLNGKIQQIENERQELLAESQALQVELADKRAVLESVRTQLAQLEGELEQTRDAEAETQARSEDQSAAADQLESVLQTLTQEMKDLLSDSEYRPPKDNSVIGGIPVDSEYVVFIIDTSGSMLRIAWPTVVKKMEEVLSVYPNVKGIQVINDMGAYMFETYAGRWIPDTPSRRKEVIRRLRSWSSFSNSSPVEGVEHAIRVFFRKGDRISLYVFGDDFASGNIDTVLEDVARYNKRDASGASRVRIHAFGFPVLFNDPQYGAHRSRFAHLMRLLAEQNSGSFVGLTELE